MSDLFSELPEFLKEYIHRSRWESFRKIQERTFSDMLESDDDVIISSGTSSGKTEAAIFPVLASLHSDPASSVGALYISPLKALINDQYSRISLILEESGISVTGWHGDVDSYVKDNLKLSPKGILQMTPESLQALIGNDADSVRRMFSDLRFVIIDEMHAFMDSERGLQLLCCLDRVERICGCTPRRIGLSATISDIDAAKEWILAGRSKGVTTIIGEDGSEMNVALSYHRLPRTDSPDGPKARRDAVADYYRKLLQVTDRNRCLVFANSRETATRTFGSMEKLIKRMGLNRKVLIHHGRLSQEVRRNTEAELGSPSRNLTVVCTSTLEMGIDIGEMDRIVQIDPPHTCSSLLQRMGRSGRRNGRQTLAIMCREDEDRRMPQDIADMNLVKALAEVQLAVDEGWTEPPHTPLRPYGLLLHQTLEYMRGSIGVLWTDLEKDILPQYPFRNIQREDYRELLRHMVSQGILTVMEDDTLLIGPEGERIAFSRDFHTVFRALSETEILYNGEVIGTIDGTPEVGDVVRVDDTLWIVRAVDTSGRRAEAEPAPENSVTTGRGMIPDIHPKVMERMRSIIMSDDIDERLTTSAKDALCGIRERCRVDAQCPISGNGAPYRIRIWEGSDVFRTVRMMLGSMDGVKVISSYEPYYIRVLTDMSVSELAERCDSISMMDASEIVLGMRINLRMGKYDRFVPDRLLSKSYVDDRLDWRTGLLSSKY